MIKGLIKKMLFEGLRKQFAKIPVIYRGLAVVGIVGLLVMFAAALA